MIHPYLPVESDELELRTGDFVYINSESLANSPDGWVEGISWLTGQIGYLPATFTERTAEMDAWTLHKKIALNYLGSGDNEDNVHNIDKDNLLKDVIVSGGNVKIGGGGVEAAATSIGGNVSSSETSLNSLEGVNVLSTPSRDAEVQELSTIKHKSDLIVIFCNAGRYK